MRCATKRESQPAWTSLPVERWVYMRWRKRTTSLAPKPLDTLLPASTYLHEGAWEAGLARKLVGNPVWLSGSTLMTWALVATTSVATATNMAMCGDTGRAYGHFRQSLGLGPRI